MNEAPKPTVSRENARKAARTEMNRAVEEARKGSAASQAAREYSGDIKVGLIFANGHHHSVAVGR